MKKTNQTIGAHWAPIVFLLFILFQGIFYSIDKAFNPIFDILHHFFGLSSHFFSCTFCLRLLVACQLTEPLLYRALQLIQLCIKLI